MAGDSVLKILMQKCLVTRIKSLYFRAVLGRIEYGDVVNDFDKELADTIQFFLRQMNTKINSLQDHKAFVEREHSFLGMVLHIREFLFHQVNANLLWPGVSIFAEWLAEHQNLLRGRQIIELDSGIAALAVFMKKYLAVDITTPDFDNKEIEENIAYNCTTNGISVLPYRGEEFLMQMPGWDLIIASDILLYMKQYSNLIKIFSFLLRTYKPGTKKADVIDDLCSQVRAMDQRVTIKVTDNNCWYDLQQHRVYLQKKDTTGDKNELLRSCFLMSWRRRIPKEHEASFFSGCEDAGLVLQHFGCRIFYIRLGKSIKF